MNLSFKDIEYFLAVVDHQGVGRAAQALSLTQPAISKAIQRMEEESGLALFDRSARRMRLSSTGRVFLEHARKLQAGYADAVRHAAELGAGRTGLLRIGATGATMEQCVVPALATLLPRRPALHAQLTIEMSDMLFEALQDGKVDLAVAPTYSNPDGALNQVALGQDSLQIVARKKHPLLYKENLDLADLTGQSWILPNSRSLARQKLAALFTQANLHPPQAALEVDFSSAAGLALVRATDMLTIAPLSLIRRSKAAGIEPLMLRHTMHLPLQISLLSRANTIWSPLMREFKEVLLGLDRAHTPAED